MEASDPIKISAKMLAKWEPDVIFHLVAVVSGEAEANLEKGYRVNLDGTRALLDTIRVVGNGYRPRLVLTSLLAVFGAPLPDGIPDDFGLRRFPADGGLYRT
jgi:nucleoside-diphosphate-sugar epimerase